MTPNLQGGSYFRRQNPAFTDRRIEPKKKPKQNVFQWRKVPHLRRKNQLNNYRMSDICPDNGIYEMDLVILVDF